MDALRTERDYQIAVAEMDRIFDAEPCSPEGDRLQRLAILVAEYEARQEASPISQGGEDETWVPTDPEQAVDALLRTMSLD